MIAREGLMNDIVSFFDPFVRLFGVRRNEAGFLLAVADVEELEVPVERFGILENVAVIEFAERRGAAVAVLRRISDAAGENTERGEDIEMV